MWIFSHKVSAVLVSILPPYLLPLHALGDLMLHSEDWMNRARRSTAKDMVVFETSMSWYVSGVLSLSSLNSSPLCRYPTSYSALLMDI